MSAAERWIDPTPDPCERNPVPNPNLAHDTIRLERVFPHPPDHVFRAYAEVDERRRWSAPSDEEFVSFQSHDFRVGGIDEFRCGRRADAGGDGVTFRGTTRYESIAVDEHIVFTERLTDDRGQLLAMSLVSWLLDGDGESCRLTIIDQVTSFAGGGPIEGSRHGYAAMLDQLDRHLGRSPQA